MPIVCVISTKFRFSRIKLKFNSLLSILIHLTPNIKLKNAKQMISGIFIVVGKILGRLFISNKSGSVGNLELSYDTLGNNLLQSLQLHKPSNGLKHASPI